MICHDDQKLIPANEIPYLIIYEAKIGSVTTLIFQGLE